MRSNLFRSFVFIITLICSLNTWADFKPEFFKTPDGLQIRYALWSSDADTDKKVTIVMLPGRSSFIEKNVDFIKDLTKLGYSVAIFDWRGMGGSDRVIDHSQKNHIVSFDTYVNDLNQFITQILKPHTSDSLVFFGTSFGGHIALRYAHDHPQDVEGIVLAAPMLGIKTAPYPRWFTKPFVKLMNNLGFTESYVLGYGDFDASKSKFETNRETNDKERYQQTMDVIHKYPQFLLGGPTYGWVNAAYNSLDLLTAYTYLQSIHQPVLLIAAGDDRQVDNSRDKELCIEMPKCVFKKYDAMHNLTKAQDSERMKLLQDTDNFISNINAVIKQTNRF